MFIPVSRPWGVTLLGTYLTQSPSGASSSRGFRTVSTCTRLHPAELRWAYGWRAVWPSSEEAGIWSLLKLYRREKKLVCGKAHSRSTCLSSPVPGLKGHGAKKASVTSMNNACHTLLFKLDVGVVCPVTTNVSNGR